MALPGTELLALGQILLIDITLAGDNAVVVGLAAATVPQGERKRVIAGGIAAAVLLRLALAVFAVRLLTIIGLTLAGGLMLLWVAWKLYREVSESKSQSKAIEKKRQSVPAAILQVAVADLSMSLDNVLAVAGAAVGHPAWVLIAGLGIAILLMAIAANYLARLLHRVSWLAYIGVAMVVFVACRMIWLGSGEVIAAYVSKPT